MIHFVNFLGDEHGCQRGSDCEVVGKAEQGRIAKERTREFEAVGLTGGSE